MKKLQQQEGNIAGSAPYLFEKEAFQALYDSCLNIYILNS